VPDTEAESLGAVAINKLNAMPGAAFVELARELRDSCDLAPFSGEQVYRRLAAEAGLDLMVSVSVDRRGYLHRLVLRRRDVESKTPSGAYADQPASQLEWVTDK